MNIFVTGWGGFIGTHVVDYLVKAGFDVSALTRLKGQSKAAANKTDFNLLYGDLNELAALPKGTDVVIHIAASHPHPTQTIPNLIHNNVLGTQRLIELAVKANVQEFIYFSTVSVYGSVQVPVLDEHTPIINPCAYGLSKLLGEHYLQELKAQLPSISFRIPAVVGPRAHRHWLAKTVEQAQQGETIHIFNEHASFNNAVYVSDLCHFIGALLTQSFTGANVVTLASSGGLTIGNVVEKILKATHSSSDIIKLPTQQTAFTVSSTHAKTAFNFIPRDFVNTLDLYLNDLAVSEP